MPKLLFAHSLQKRADQSPRLMRLLWRLEATVLAAIGGLSRLLPLSNASNVGAWLLRHLGPRLEKSNKFRQNLQVAFPDKSPQAIEQLVQECWSNAGAVLAEYAHLSKLCDKEADERIELVSLADPALLRPDNQGVIFVSAHLANWEIPAGYAARHLGLSIIGLYTPQQNPWIDQILKNQRQALGYNLLSRYDKLQLLLRHLAKGGSVALLTDQRFDTGEPVPFFGREMLTTTTPARLALRFKRPLLPVQIERQPNSHFRITVHPPIRPEDPSADLSEQIISMTRQLNQHFEEWIRANPGQWLCSKRRWPKNTSQS